MAGNPESRLVSVIKDNLRAQFRGALIIKVHGSAYMATGLPDLLMFHRGRAWALEVKHQRVGESPERARGRCTPAQLEMIRKFRAAGIRADCVLTPSEAVALVSGGPYFITDEFLDGNA